MDPTTSNDQPSPATSNLANSVNSSEGEVSDACCRRKPRCRPRCSRPRSKCRSRRRSCSKPRRSCRKPKPCCRRRPSCPRPCRKRANFCAKKSGLGFCIKPKCETTISERRCCHRKGPMTANPWLNFMREYRARCCHRGSVTATTAAASKAWSQLTKCQKMKYYKMARKVQCRGKRPCCRTPRKRCVKCPAPKCC